MIAQQLMIFGFGIFAAGLLGALYAVADPEVMGAIWRYRVTAATGAATMTALFWLAPWQDSSSMWFGRIVMPLLFVTLLLPELTRLGKAIDARLQPVIKD